MALPHAFWWQGRPLDAAIRVVRRPTGPQPASLLGRVVWCSNVNPRLYPALAQSNIGMPYDVTPAAERPEGYGLQGAQGPPLAPGGFGPPPRQDQRQGQQDGQWPAYGHDHGQLGQQQSDRQSRPPTSPDGVRLAGWWKRVLARIIDGIIEEAGYPRRGRGHQRGRREPAQARRLTGGASRCSVPGREP